MTADPYNSTAYGHAIPGTASDTDEERPWAETIARAEAAVAELAANYPDVALRDIADSQAALDAAKMEPAHRQEHIERLFAIVHNIKGQGGSFGFPLVTRIGQSLCQLIKQSAAVRESDLSIIQVHLDALELILKKRIKGDGGETANKLAAHLEALTRREA